MAGLDVYALLEQSFREMRLPPTPPDEYAQQPGVLTPPSKQNLPTPDMTPPGLLVPLRPLLSHHSSSRADSFRTAREEIINTPVDEDHGDSQRSRGLDVSDHVRHLNKDGSIGASSQSRQSPSPGAQRVKETEGGRKSSSLRGSGLARLVSSPVDNRVSDEERAGRLQHGLGNAKNGYLSSSYVLRNGHERDVVASDKDVVQSLNNLYRTSPRYTEKLRELPTENGSLEPRTESDIHGDGFRRRALSPYAVNRRSRRHSLEDPEMDGSDWDKHVSYISEGDQDPEYNALLPAVELSSPGPRTDEQSIEAHPTNRDVDEQLQSPLIAPSAPEPNTLTSLDSSDRPDTEPPSTHDISSDTASFSHDSNNMVYKQIQDGNIDRFAALAHGRAIEATIRPLTEERSHALKRVRRCHSLRADSASDASPSIDGSPKGYVAQRNKFSLKYRMPYIPQSSGPGLRSVSLGDQAMPSLRHERRSLSATGIPIGPSTPQMVHRATRLSKTPSDTVSLGVTKPRQSSLPIRLSSDAEGSTSLSRGTKKQHLRRSSKEYRIENQIPGLHTLGSHGVVPTNLAVASPRTPSFSALSPYMKATGLANATTPLSVSAWSDRTDAEVCEATNVPLFVHRNESVFVVQDGSRPASEGNLLISGTKQTGGSSPPQTGLGLIEEMPDVQPPAPAPAPAPRVEFDIPSITINGNNLHAVDSPLTNPRMAPDPPPVIKFIPPTPSEEIDRQLGSIDALTEANAQKRPTLASRARRYSDIVIQPLFTRSASTRSRNMRRHPLTTERHNGKLHPMWHPNYMWEDDYDMEDDDDIEPLPRGGDTSEHPRSLFPHSMSVRMPGFRGQGGFLVGNSLGMDRHGSNKRRHHVSLPSTNRTMLKYAASSDSLRQMAGGSSGQRTFRIPGTRTKVQFVGVRGFRERMSKLREAREEHAREKRRSQLKDRIGPHIVHDS